MWCTDYIDMDMACACSASTLEHMGCLHGVAILSTGRGGGGAVGAARGGSVR